MPLDPTTFLALASACAPAVAPSTLLAVGRAESGLDPLAIGQNGPRVLIPKPRNAEEAAARATALIAAGSDVDLGVAQINVSNLARLGLTVRDAFDPCHNLAAAGAILGEGYRRGAAELGSGQRALQVALSYYNTGHPRRGFANGYVARVLGRAAAPAAPATAPEAAPPMPSAQPAPPAWDVFARARLRPPAFTITTSGALP